MRHVYTIIMATLLFATSACSAQSIDRTTVDNLDLKRYMGRWYEIARYDHSFERNMDRCEAFYSLEPNGKILVRNSGVDAKTLAGILGHTNASFTLDTYTHVTKDMQKQAADVMGGFLDQIL